MNELAFASGQLGSAVGAEAAISASPSEVDSMRERLEVLRDVLIALGLQLVFRATVLLRRWNY